MVESIIRSGLLPDGNQTLDRGREGNNGTRTSAEVLKERNRRKGLQRSGGRVTERHGGIKDDVRRMVQRRKQHGRDARNGETIDERASEEHLDIAKASMKELKQIQVVLKE